MLSNPHLKPTRQLPTTCSKMRPPSLVRLFGGCCCTLKTQSRCYILPKKKKPNLTAFILFDHWPMRILLPALHSASQKKDTSGSGHFLSCVNNCKRGGVLKHNGSKWPQTGTCVDCLGEKRYWFASLCSWYPCGKEQVAVTRVCGVCVAIVSFLGDHSCWGYWKNNCT